MIIAVANQKGGAGKSTTAAAMAAAITIAKGRKRRTLIIDMDAQGNTTYATAAALDRPTIFDVLTKHSTAADAIQATAYGDIIASSHQLAMMDSVLVETGKERRLKEKLAPVADEYDFIILDTPPALGVLTINALTAAAGVIIPTNADHFGLQGIMQLYGQIETVQNYTNPDLKVLGILLTRHALRRRILRDYAAGLDGIAAKMGTGVYTTFIRECTQIREAQASQQSIFQYAPRSTGAEDYAAFAAEFLKTIRGKRGG